MFEVIIPKIEANAEEVVLVEWLKKEGDTVQKGEPIFIIETLKAVITVNSEESGILHKILIQAGETVPVLKVVASLRKTDEPALIQNGGSIAEQSKVRASPKAKKLAKEKCLELQDIFKDSDKIIQEKDIEAYLAEKEANGVVMHDLNLIKREEIQSLNKSREYLASSLSISIRTSPVKAKIEKQVTKEGLRISIGEYISFAAAQTLRSFPLLNSYFSGNKISLYSRINIGFVISIDDNLLVPVIHDADKCGIASFLEQMKNLVLKAVKGALSLNDVNESTFTITDLSSYNVTNFLPIINVRQSAILGICSEEDGCAFVNGKLVYEPKLNLVVVFDHRVTNGKYAAEFLNTLKDKLET